jgi:arylsulfatase A-like enzyme/tetratricopeptide (TPR) repeat protein
MRFPALLLVAVMALPGTLVFSAAAGDVKRDDRLNVLLVTLDTTRADRVGAYGYPKAETPVLDSLARGGVRFANAYCSTPLTLPSHCSILTGTYPLRHKVRNNGAYYLADEAVTLAERLKENGYATSAFVASFNTDSRFGLGQGFDVYDDRFGDDEMLKTFRSERTADKVADAFLAWLGARSPERFFSWVHFFDPHAPYEPPPPYKERFAGDPYDGEIAFMDHELGRIIERLRATGVLDSTLIVVAGDHGESLGEKGESNHGIFIYEAAMKVPLILSASGNLPRGLVVNARVRLNDIMPTVLDALKIPVNPEVQGESLLPFIDGKKSENLTCYLESFYPTETFGWSELIGIVDGDWKFIRAPRSEIYDLKKDPKEEKDLASREARTAALLNRKLDEVIRTYVSNAEPGRRTLTGDEEDRLRSLGYVGAGAAPRVGKGPLPDPKDRIGESAILSRAKLLESEEKYGEAEKCFRELLGLRPDVPWHYIGLGALLVKAERVGEGIEVLKEGLKKMPDSVVLLSRLASFYMKVGRFSEASEASRAALNLDPRNFDATAIAGWSEDMRANWAEAAGFYRKALDIEPENKTVRMKYAYVLGAMGRGEEAARMDEALKKEYPGDPKICTDLSVIYTALGKMDLAEENLRRAVTLSPSPENHHRLASLLGRMGRFADAVAQMELFLKNTKEGETPRKAKARDAVAEWERRIKER